VGDEGHIGELGGSTLSLGWENFYNDHRPHGGLGGLTPYERLKQRTQTRM